MIDVPLATAAVLALGWGLVLSRAPWRRGPGAPQVEAIGSALVGRFASGAPPASVVAALERADLPGPVARWWHGGLTAAGGSALVGATVAGPVGALLCPTVVVVAASLVLVSLSGRRTTRLEGDLPGLLEEVARALRAGLSLPQALADAARTAPAPLGPALADVVTSADHGVPLASAIDGWARRFGGSGMVLAADALVLADRLGGSPAHAIDRVAATQRARNGVRAEVRANAAQARASAALLVAVPPLFAIGLAVTDPRVAHTLTATVPGLACVVVGLALEASGALWMTRLTRALR